MSSEDIQPKGLQSLCPQSTDLHRRKPRAGALQGGVVERSNHMVSTADMFEGLNPKL